MYWATSTTWHWNPSRCFLKVIEALLCELITALWELHAWILVNEWFVKLTERPVLLPYYPWFLPVEEDFNDVHCVVSVVNRVFFNFGIFNLTLKLHLEEMRPTEVAHIFRASLNMLEEYLSWIEGVTELTLSGHAVLETLVVNFHFNNLLTQLSILIFLLTNCFT